MVKSVNFGGFGIRVSGFGYLVSGIGFGEVHNLLEKLALGAALAQVLHDPLLAQRNNLFEISGLRFRV